MTKTLRDIGRFIRSLWFAPRVPDVLPSTMSGAYALGREGYVYEWENPYPGDSPLSAAFDEGYIDARAFR